MDFTLLGILFCMVAPSIGQPPGPVVTTTTIATTTTTTDPNLGPAKCSYDSDCSPVYRVSDPRLVCKNGSCFDCTEHSVTRYCIDHQSSQNARVGLVTSIVTGIILLVIFPVCVGCVCFFCPGCPVHESHQQRGQANGEIMFVIQREVIRSAHNSRQESLGTGGTGPNAISGQTEGLNPNPDTKVAIEGDKK